MKKVLVSLMLVVVMLVGVVVPLEGRASAVYSELCQDLEKDSPEYAAAGCGGQNDAGTVASSVIQVVLGFIGVIAVGVMIYGGFLFLTSSGDAGKVKRGQDAIKYGLIGLVVALLAYAIVTFVSMMVS